MPVLVTGGTGGLGRPTVERLRATGSAVRVLSRRPGPDHVIGDLDRGTGIAEALQGVDTILHLATNRKRDLPATERLVTAARAAGVAHFVYISIVGVDDVPYAYYRDKLGCEQSITASGVAHTILRATQFHSFPIEVFLRPQRGLPVTFVTDARFQPIAEDEVGARLVELGTGPPAGRVADIAGPEVLTLRQMADLWRTAQGRPARCIALPFPGGFGRALREGGLLGTLPGYGTQTFAQYLTKTLA